ncbi:MarR family winged helix-turn-helix transcriptional regulator [Herbiconiux sp. SYSU D00978]|uniref:MarR family winged helix-turn-helix transcriptional regulator n=1 Tax=Herbiconiux sp. SYSU D00978 TaxID=2812562 RepID=UPI0027DB5397|nr:MarR family transcriptional regulator [Herbiconiux sp. SYSU D00978]
MSFEPPTITSALKRVQTNDLSAELRVGVGRLSRRLRAEKADSDLSDGQVSVLAILFRDGAHTLSQLSDLERVTPPSMSRTVNALEQAGYLQRTESPDDGRKVLLSITDAGRDVVRETRRRRDAWLFQRLKELSPEQRRVLSEAAAIMKELAGK